MSYRSKRPMCWKGKRLSFLGTSRTQLNVIYFEYAIVHNGRHNFPHDCRDNQVQKMAYTYPADSSFRHCHERSPAINFSSIRPSVGPCRGPVHRPFVGTSKCAEPHSNGSYHRLPSTILLISPRRLLFSGSRSILS